MTNDIADSLTEEEEEELQEELKEEGLQEELQNLRLASNFTSDLLSAALSLFLVIIVWYSFIQVIYPFLYITLDILGLIAAMLIMMFLLSYTFGKASVFLSVLAYQSATWRTGIPYMNSKTKCPYLERKWLTFSCRAEQLADFDVPAFQRCHHEDLWLQCWPDRVPSILQVFDSSPSKKQQHFGFILASMKENARTAGFKMLEVLTSETYTMDVRLSAGYALSEMKDETGLLPLIEMVGSGTDNRQEQTIKAVITRYKELAVPDVITALNSCTDDDRCGGFAEILGKIGDERSISTLEEILVKETSGEYTRLQSIYALQEIGTVSSCKALIAYLEYAPEDEKQIVKDACLSKKLITFPILIELLTHDEISEEYYAEIGDILAQAQAPTYDKLFTKLEDEELVKKLASILKEHTPEEEEFLPLHEVLDQYI
jgi:hypothetical protein